ncbi:MAG: ferrous iron transporter B [Clostridia bacterium]|nr:ferrous iron transporter B [Clostridia bacterium]
MSKATQKPSVTVALAGNPNVGKSTIFNTLTGMKQHTGNWAGKTVSNAKGHCQSENFSYTFVDIPGTYSLFAHSPEEEIARDFLRSGASKAVVVVCDATCLERNLNLCLQIMEICENVIVCVNLLDQAKSRYIKVDLEKLSQELGVKVVGTIGHKKKSVKAILSSLDDLILNNKNTRPKNIQNNTIYDTINKAEKIAKEVVSYENKPQKSLESKLDSVFTSKAFGYPIMLMFLALIFWITISGANYPSALLSQLFFFLEDKLSAFLQLLKAPWWIHDSLTYGIFRTVGWVVSVMLPPMAIFFPLFTLLEDSGYLPRIAFNLDYPFKKCNACGKQALTMCMGFGCNAVGVTGCRIIDSKRERLLAIITNNLVPCNGRFPTIIAIITMFLCIGVGFTQSLFAALCLTAVILLGIIATFSITKLLSKTLLKGVPSSYTLELPPYRKPRILKVILRSIFDRTLFVLGRSLAVAAPAGLLIWIMANINVNDISILHHCANFLDPFAQLLGLDGVILLAFILGLPANEIVMPIVIMAYTNSGSLTELSSLNTMKDLFIANGWDYTTAISVILFSLLHWPCATTILTIKKETNSLNWTLLAVLLPTILSILVCMVFNFIMKIF